MNFKEMMHYKATKSKVNTCGQSKKAEMEKMRFKNARVNEP